MLAWTGNQWRACRYLVPVFNPVMSSLCLTLPCLVSVSNPFMSSLWPCYVCSPCLCNHKRLDSTVFPFGVHSGITIMVDWAYKMRFFPFWMTKAVGCTETWPWYNRNGWLGIKHQVTYLLCRNITETVFFVFAVWLGEMETSFSFPIYVC